MADRDNALTLTPVPVRGLARPVLGCAALLAIPLFGIMAQGALSEGEHLGRSLWVALIASLLIVAPAVIGLLGWAALGNALIRLTVTDTELIARNRWGRVRRMRIADIEEMVTGTVRFSSAVQDWLVVSAGPARRPIQLNLSRWQPREYRLLLDDLDVAPEEVGDLRSDANRRRFRKLRFPLRAGHEGIYYTLWMIAVVLYIGVAVNIAFRV